VILKAYLYVTVVNQFHVLFDVEIPQDHWKNCKNIDLSACCETAKGPSIWSI
jgi:hypothetical protein